MEVQLSNLNVESFDVRDEVDERHVEQIQESLEEDGQWNPIIIRPDGEGGYDIIAGHTRYRAAEQLGWDALDAKVKDVEDDEAKKLALKTNLKRKGMSKVEQGKVLNDLAREKDYSQTELAERVGKSKKWVSQRMQAAADLPDKVVGMIEGDSNVAFSHARFITKLESEKDQVAFAELIDEKDANEGELDDLLTRFKNDTLATIGYEGKDFPDFVVELDEADVDIVVDIRDSATSDYKPAFSKEMLEQRLPDNGIEYRHVPDFGVPYAVRNAYKEGYLSDRGFASMYEWVLYEDSDVDVEDFTWEMEETGKPALLCYEKHAKPRGDQDINCHRDLLAEVMMDVTRDGVDVFSEREDL
jgi:ParB family chromosome partitioning protein